MDRIVALIDYLRAEPRVAVAAAIGILVLYFLLQRKSRLERESERRMNALREERGGRYNSLRPPH
jgi:hypothetical protein